MKDLQFHLRLLMEPGLVSDDLNGAMGQLAVVVNFQNLPKRSFAKNIQNFITVRKVVSDNSFVVASLIIKPPVVLSYRKQGCYIMVS